MLATDHFGPFYLTNSLMPNIKASKEGRILIAGSVIHEMLMGSYDVDEILDVKLNRLTFGTGMT